MWRGFGFEVDDFMWGGEILVSVDSVEPDILFVGAGLFVLSLFYLLDFAQQLPDLLVFLVLLLDVNILWNLICVQNFNMILIMFLIICWLFWIKII